MAIDREQLDQDPRSADYGYPLPVKFSAFGHLPVAPPNSLVPSPAVTAPPSPNLNASAPVPIPLVNAAPGDGHGPSHGQTLQVPTSTVGGNTVPEITFATPTTTTVAAASTDDDFSDIPHTAIANLTLASGSDTNWTHNSDTTGHTTPVGGRGGSSTATATDTVNNSHHSQPGPPSRSLPSGASNNP